VSFKPVLFWFSIVALTALTACTSKPIDSDGDQQRVTEVQENAWTRFDISQQKSLQATGDKPQWQHYQLPGKHATQYSYVRLDGRDAMAGTAKSSASLLRQKIRIEPQDLAQIKFSWKVPALIAMADLAVRENADSPVRIVLAFEGDRSKLSAKNAMLSELAHAMTGEPLPYATLMYVWCNSCDPGTVITSSRSDRIRKMVVESGTQNLNMWMDYERNIRADYEKAFGEAPGALVGIGIMTDSDNTRSTTRAWYGRVQLASAESR
jgi:Protein of unknown function (DUF3047)